MSTFGGRTICWITFLMITFTGKISGCIAFGGITHGENISAKQTFSESTFSGSTSRGSTFCGSTSRWSTSRMSTSGGSSSVGNTFDRIIFD